MFWDKISESRIVNGLTRIGIVVCVVCFLLQIYALQSAFVLSEGRAVFENFADYYVYYPTVEYNRYNAKENTENLAQWAETANTEIVQLDLTTFGKQDLVKVVTYANTSAFEMSWDSFSVPLKEGRWFKGEANEVIAINHDSYELGDKIELVDLRGNKFKAAVVGVAEYDYLPNDYGMNDDLMYSVSEFDGSQKAFLLNPRSTHNEKVNTVNQGAIMFKTDSPILLSKMSDYGTYTKMSEILRDNKPDFLKCVGVMIASLTGLVLLGVFGHKVFGYAGIDWCVILAGYIAFSTQYKSYFVNLANFAITIVVCIVIILSYAGIVVWVNRSKDKYLKYTVTITETKKWNDENLN